MGVRLRRLADRARASARANADDREARDDEIEAADLLGWGVSEIGRAARMERQHVHKIVIARAVARQRRAAAG